MLCYVLLCYVDSNWKFIENGGIILLQSFNIASCNCCFSDLLPNNNISTV